MFAGSVYRAKRSMKGGLCTDTWTNHDDRLPLRGGGCPGASHSNRYVILWRHVHAWSSASRDVIGALAAASFLQLNVEWFWDLTKERFLFYNFECYIIHVLTKLGFVRYCKSIGLISNKNQSCSFFKRDWLVFFRMFVNIITNILFYHKGQIYKWKWNLSTSNVALL